MSVRKRCLSYIYYLMACGHTIRHIVGTRLPIAAAMLSLRQTRPALRCYTTLPSGQARLFSMQRPAAAVAAPRSDATAALLPALWAVECDGNCA